MEINPTQVNTLNENKSNISFGILFGVYNFFSYIQEWINTSISEVNKNFYFVCKCKNKHDKIVTNNKTR
jgi:hypothetical protein